MALDEGCDKYHITYSSDGHGSLPIFDKEGRYIGLGVGKVMSMYEEFVDSVNIYNIDIYNIILIGSSVSLSLVNFLNLDIQLTLVS